MKEATWARGGEAARAVGKRHNAGEGKNPRLKR
jgi:hypothetical protein